jgi:hypothetical protein
VQHSLVWALIAMPYGMYDGTSSFGIYDTLPNNLTMVANYVMRSVDYPTNTDIIYTGTNTASTADTVTATATSGPQPGSTRPQARLSSLLALFAHSSRVSLALTEHAPRVAGLWPEPPSEISG